MIVLDYGTPESLECIRRHANELAASSSSRCRAGIPDLRPVEFLRELRKITEESGTALIFDEVVTGFRVHPGGVQALFGIRADSRPTAKLLGGGMPIGVLAGKAKFMDALDGGMWQYGDDSFPEVGVTFFAGTFVRHPLALAAATAVLQAPQGSRARAATLGRRESRRAVVQTAERDFAERGSPSRTWPTSLRVLFQLAARAAFGSLLYYHMRQKGIHIQEGFPCFLTPLTFRRGHRQDHRSVQGEHHAESCRNAGRRPFAAEPRPRCKAEAVADPVGPERRRRAAEGSPLTESQMEIWLSARLSDEANCAYNESFTLQMRGELESSRPCRRRFRRWSTVTTRCEARSTRRNCIRVLAQLAASRCR